MEIRAHTGKGHGFLRLTLSAGICSEITWRFDPF